MYTTPLRRRPFFHHHFLRSSHFLLVLFALASDPSSNAFPLCRWFCHFLFIPEEIVQSVKMASSYVLMSAAAASVAAYGEYKFSPMIFAQPTDGQVSPLFVLTPSILLGVGFFALVHGVKVGAARRKYMELAKKDGEKDADIRYAYPNLYVDGNSKHARAFNCMQRSHQHIFETFPAAILGGLLGASQFPLATACSTLVYAVGRISFSTSYGNSDGDATKRYAGTFARYHWFGLLGNFVLGFAATVMTLMKVKFAS